MEAAVCDICNNNNFDVVSMEYFTEHSGGKKYPVVTCVCCICGHVFMNPRQRDSELDEFYKKQFRESFEVSRGEKIGLFKEEMDFITKVLGHGNGRHALEIGCYAGYMLKRLQDNGWDVEGVEPNPTSANRARELFGINVHTFTINDFAVDKSECYDLIVMGSVLEHVNSPTRTLLKVNRLLKEDGHLLIRVPDVENPNLDTVSSIFVLEHPNMFSRNAIRMLYQKTGMDEIEEMSHEKFKQHIISMAQKKMHTDKEKSFTISNHHDKTLDLINSYSIRINAERQRIELILEHLYYPEPRNVAIYGAGNHTEFLLRYTGLNRANIKCLLDSNPEKLGAKFLGFDIRDPVTIDLNDINAVVISSRAFQEEIYQRIQYMEKKGVEVIQLYKLS